MMPTNHLVVRAVCTLVAAFVCCVVAAPAQAQDPSPPPSGGGGSVWPERSPYPIPSNDPGPGLTSPEALGAQMEKVRYDLYYEATGALWEVNKALFVATDELEAFRAAIIDNVELLLGIVAPSLVPIVRRLVLLAIPLGLIGYLLAGVVTIQLSSVKRTIVLAMVIPFLFPVMGMVFGAIEGTRADIGRYFGALVFDATSAALGTSTPIDYQGDGNRLAEIAASAMYLDVSDVDAADMTMPDRFISGVYTVPATNWSSVGAATRSAYLIQVTEGLRIMRFAVVPSTLMVLDAIVQAQWSVILGGAFLGFTFALSFAMFGPFAGEAYRLFVTVFNLVMTSWIVSSFQGMLVAWLFYLSVSGTALGVIVISAVLVVVYVIFMLALIAVGARVFFLSVGVLMPDMPDALHGATRRVGGAVIGGVVGGVAGAIGMTALDERTPGPIPNVEA